MSTRIPKPNLTKKQLKMYTTDPEVVILEVLFVVLTLCNVFVMHRLLFSICPFPVTVTWFQFLVGLIYAVIIGEANKEFTKCKKFPKFSLRWSLYESLGSSTIVYLGMCVMANILLHSVSSIITFPIVVSLSVVIHHLGRFLGCGQIYYPVRWVSILIMFVGFLLVVFDKTSAGARLVPPAILYALFSSIFRGWCLEKAMHVVEGRGNVLHNHQVVLGLILLPFLGLLRQEYKFFEWMPLDFSKTFTWQVWGCLFSAGTIPFLRNIVANRMCRITGQAPWRVLELITILLVLIIGSLVYGPLSLTGLISFFLIVTGRTVGVYDALSRNPFGKQHSINSIKSSSFAAKQQPNDTYNYKCDSTGVTDFFELENENSPLGNETNQGSDWAELNQRKHLVQDESVHQASIPLLNLSSIQSQ